MACKLSGFKWLFSALLALLVTISGCTGMAPSVTGVPDYEPEDGEELHLALPEPEIELPPLPAEDKEPPEEETIVYLVSPSGGYNEGGGYLRLSYEQKGDRGEITVHIGHKEIDGANTKWYSYSLLVDGKAFSKRGMVSVPFVRGRDNYWWNEEQIILPGPVGEKARITVYSDYADEEYTFTITKQIAEL